MEKVSDDFVARVSRAIQAELRRQGVLWEFGENVDILMIASGEAADMASVSRAAINAVLAETGAANAPD